MLVTEYLMENALMAPCRIALLATALTLYACAALQAPHPEVPVVDTIPLIITQSGPDSQLIEIEVQIDGQTQRLLFDTGAASSGVSTTPFTNHYPTLSAGESTGVSGKSLSCDLIQPARIVFGKHITYQPKLQRCNRDLFGIDLLRDLAFRIDMKRSEFAIIQRLPIGPPQYQLNLLSAGHIAMPLNVGFDTTRGLFDTGADKTVIDSRFVQLHADDFDFVRPDTGSDANGNAIKSGIYRCKILQIGPLRLRDLEVAVFDFGDVLRQSMEQVPIILGTDVIAQARWNIDLASAQWSAQTYER